MALEWLKNILGDAYTPDIDKAVAAEIGAVYAPKAEMEALTEKTKALEAQVQTAGETIRKFDGLDPDKVKAEVEQYKQAAAQAQKDADARVEALRFDQWFADVARGAGARSAKAARAVLGDEKLEALRTSTNRDEDAKKLLQELQASDGYLFAAMEAAPPPYAAGTGTGQPPQGESLADAISAQLLHKQV